MRLLRYCLPAILCLVMSSYAQTIRPLNIGDTVPDIAFTNVLNYPASTIHLSDFKGKLVILDFWATWCSSCFKMFPVADSLQQHFKNDVQIVLVNSITGSGDSEIKIAGFLKKWKDNYKQLRLPIAQNDTMAKAFFPHTFLPHYIWIGKDRTVVGITSSEELTEKNIRLLLKGCAPAWELKTAKLFQKEQQEVTPEVP